MKVSFIEKQDEYQDHRVNSSDSANSQNRVRNLDLYS